MDSIFSKVNLPSIPVDLLNTLRIFFEKGSLQNKTLFEQLFVAEGYQCLFKHKESIRRRLFGND